jgi:hypothetical protein
VPEAPHLTNVFINGRNNFSRAEHAAFFLKDLHNKPKTDEMTMGSGAAKGMWAD